MDWLGWLLFGVVAALAAAERWRLARIERGLRADLQQKSDSLSAALRDDLARADAAARERQIQSEEIARLKAARDDALRLLDAAPFPLWRRDAGGKLVWVNTHYAELTETTPQEAVARGLELASAHDLDRPRELALEALRNREARSEERRFVVDGDRRNYRVFELPAADGVLGFGQDITPEADARGQLKRHMEAHMEVLRTISTATAIFGPDKKLILWNRAYARLWQLDEAWLENRPLFGEVLEQLRAARRLPEQIDWQAYKRAQTDLFTQVIDRKEELIHLPDGSTLRLAISAYPSGGLLFAYDDVTRQLTLERATNTMIAVQRATLDNLYEAVVVYGSDGRLSLYNRAFSGLWKFEPEFLNRRPHLTEILEAARPLMQRGQDWSAWRERAIENFTTRRGGQGRIERGDGAVIDYAGVPLPDGAMLYTYLDVTDTIRIERALRERNEALERTDRMNAAFIANITHELRSPLGTLISMTEVLAQGILGPMNARQEEYARDMMQTSRHLLRLLDDIIAIATIEVGQMTLEPEDFDAAELWRGAAADWAALAERRGIGFAITEADLALRGDRQRLRQAVGSVVGVALNGTPQGGRVTVAARHDPAARLFLLRIESHAGGLQPLRPTRLFADLVDQADRRRADADLSLVVARGLIALHGGQVRLPDGDAMQAVEIVLPLPAEAGIATPSAAL